MNAERMHAVARALRNDLEQTELPQRMQALVVAMQNAIAQPQDPPSQDAVAQARSAVRDALQSSSVDTWAPVDRQVLESWGIAGLLGRDLLDHIDETFRENQVTMSSALEEISQWNDEVASILAHLVQAASTFEFFNVGAEELGPGEFEIDVLIPRPAVDDELDQLGREFQQLNRIFQPFIELTGGSYEPIKVKSIGSSDFTVFLQAASDAALAVSVAVNEILTVYENILTIRKLRKSIEETPGLDDAAKQQVAAPLEESAMHTMAEGITRIAAGVMSDFASEDLEAGRRQELEVAVTVSLRSIAKRIDESYSVTVRTGPALEPVEPDPESDEPPEDPDAELRAAVERVRELQGRQEQFRQMEGLPVLGELVAGDDPADA